MKTRTLWMAQALTLAAFSCHPAIGSCTQEQQEAHTPPPLKPLIPTTTPPTYHTLSSYDARWKDLIEEGIELARSYWGSYGPAHVWIIGYEDDDIENEANEQDFLKEYCTWRTRDTNRTMDECLPHATRMFIDVAQSGTPEAYLSEVRERDPRTAEPIFINVHKWYFKDDPVPDPILRGIHEYTHVAQLGVGPMPTWLMEGGAVFSEAWLPALKGRGDPRRMMRHFMDSAHRVDDPSLSIADMEEIETASPEVAKYHRELAYDAGAWAVTFMIYKSPTRSVASLRDAFYPRVAEVGWEAALPEYVGMKDKDAFYEAFANFMELPREEQLQVFDALKP